MKTADDIELVRGSGNTFRDFGYIDAEALHLKAKLAAKIIGILEDEKLSARIASEITGVPSSEFSQIRNARLGKLTIERMLKILAALGQDVDVNVTFNGRSELNKLRSA